MPPRLSDRQKELNGNAATPHDSALHAPMATPTTTNHKKHILIHAVACFTFSCIAISAAGEAVSNTTGSKAGYTTLSVVAAATAFLTKCMASCQWRCLLGLQSNLEQRKVQAADCSLIFLSILVPCTLLLLDFNPLPVSDNRLGNDFMTLGFLLRLGVALDLPPKHCFVQFLLTFPFFMFLDYHRQQEHPAPYPGANQHMFSRHDGTQPELYGYQSVFLNYMLSRGLYILLLALLVHGIFIVLAMKREQSELSYSRDLDTGASSSRASSTAELPAPELAPAPASASCLPLQTFKLSGLFLLMDPLLQQLELSLSHLAELIDEQVLVALVCVPVGLWYLSLALLSRMLPKSVSVSSVAADEWMVVLSIFFVLGRHSCKVDMLPLIGSIQCQLTRSQDILADILPSHVLRPLLNTWVKEPGEAPAAPRSSFEDSSRQSSVPVMELSEPASSFSPLSTLHSIFHPEHSELSFMQKIGRHSLEAVRSTRSGQLLQLSPKHTPPQQAPPKLTEIHECVSIFFSDICDFASWVHQLPAAKVMQTLDDLYSRLDDIIIKEMPGLYKVETIGDGYMVAANLMTKDEHHAATILSFALRAQEEACKVLRPDKQDGSSLQLRIGVHSGPAVSGSVGNLRRNFCLFGNTINMASRTQTSCPPGCIQITEACHQLAVPQVADRIVFKDRGLVSVKGASKPLHMYLVMTRQMLAMSRSLKQAGIDL